MSAVDIQMYEKKNTRMFFVSLFLFLWVVVVTVWLFFYVWRVESQAENLQNDLATLEASIETLQQDTSIQVYQRYTWNIAYIQKLAEKSNIPLFVAHLKKTFRKYALEAQWFVYDGEKISLAVKWQTNDAGYAYEKVVKFLREYNIETWEKNPFILQNVTAFSGYDTLTHNVEFLVK